MSFIKEFKTFAMRGNVIDFAVGIVVGAAFGKIINSLVSDIIMPPIGLLIGGVDFNTLSVVLREAYNSHPAVTIRYGLFINTIIDFILITLAIFLMLKAINKFRKPSIEPETVKNCPQCLLSIPVLAKRCGHCTQLLD